MDRLAPLWNELLSQQGHTVFQRFAWNRLAAGYFSDRVTPHIVCVEGEAGAAILPAGLNHASGHLELLGEALFDYRDVLHAGEEEPLQHAWRLLASLRLPMRIIAVDQASAQRRWGDFPLTPFVSAPRVDRGAIDEAAFRMAHARLGRQMRRLQKQGAEFHTHAGGETQVLRRLYEGKRADFAADGQHNVFLDRRRADFLVAAAALEDSDCAVYTLEKQDELVAGVVTFRDEGIRRFYTIYFNPRWARYSPGVALLYEATARSLGEGFCCDYMTGEYPYKLRLANATQPLFRVDLSARQLAEIASRGPALEAA
jgi:CelD/BcsL family acetyltransferase involved in cellulose biosynthesis